jgi:hypothetical protein
MKLGFSNKHCTRKSTIRCAIEREYFKFSQSGKKTKQFCAVFIPLTTVNTTGNKKGANYILAGLSSD